jgi:hypothetical protein
MIGECEMETNWTGGSSGVDFADPGNWSNGVPSTGDNGHFASSVAFNGATLDPGITLTLAAGATLDFGGSASGEGSDAFVMGAGAVIKGIVFGFDNPGSGDNFGMLNAGLVHPHIARGATVYGRFRADVFTPSTLEWDYNGGEATYFSDVVITGAGTFRTVVPVDGVLGGDYDLTLQDQTNGVGAYIAAGAFVEPARPVASFFSKACGRRPPPPISLVRLETPT